MASFDPKTGKWRARRKREGYVINIGYYPTREEAERHERDFDEFWPPAPYRKGHPVGGRGNAA